MSQCNPRKKSHEWVPPSLDPSWIGLSVKETEKKAVRWSVFIVRQPLFGSHTEVTPSSKSRRPLYAGWWCWAWNPPVKAKRCQIPMWDYCFCSSLSVRWIGGGKVSARRQLTLDLHLCHLLLLPPGLLSPETFVFKPAQCYSKDLMLFNGHICFPKIIKAA